MVLRKILQASEKAFVREVIEGKVCIAQYIPAFLDTKKFRCFQPHDLLNYDPFCDDFGPMSISCVIRFIELLDLEMMTFRSERIVFCVEDGGRALANAIFLLGAYMILKSEFDIQRVIDIFQWMDNFDVELFRDATFARPDFGLDVRDCWKGLERAKGLGWIRKSKPNSCIWGSINIDEYEKFNNPLTWDLHIVVPGKFIAFKGPADLDGRTFSDEGGHRRFSPHHYSKAFLDLGVSAVIRLNESEYDTEDFLSYGISHHDLYFHDCTAPPEHIIHSFFNAVDSSSTGKSAAAAAATTSSTAAGTGGSGLLAVHCKAGLGRTGTMIALYLMRSCGFDTARAAIAWLRIMRPGSIIGEQQHFLVSCEASISRFPCRSEISDHSQLVCSKDIVTLAGVNHLSSSSQLEDPGDSDPTVTRRSRTLAVAAKEGAPTWSPLLPPMPTRTRISVRLRAGRPPNLNFHHAYLNFHANSNWGGPGGGVAHWHKGGRWHLAALGTDYDDLQFSYICRSKSKGNRHLRVAQAQQVAAAVARRCMVAKIVKLVDL